MKIEEQIFIHELPEDQRWLIGRGDMTVSRSGADSTGTDVVLLEAPAIGRVPLSVDIERPRFGSRPLLVTSGEAWYLPYCNAKETRIAMP